MMSQAKVLEPLGAVTSGSQFLEPDGNTELQAFKVFSTLDSIYQFNERFFFVIIGMFPNHIPNPEDKAAMKAITQAVLDNKADLGIIFDTDVDR